MEVRHNTSLLEKAVEHSVHNASIPSRKAEAAAQQVEARAHGFRRLATGGAIAIAAVGIGFGVWLALHEPKDGAAQTDLAQVSALEEQLRDAEQVNHGLKDKQTKAEQANEELRRRNQEVEQELADLRSQKDESRLESDTNTDQQMQKIAEQEQELEEARRTITDLRQRLDSMTGGDPLTNYSIFKTNPVSYKGKTWDVTTGHEFASNLDKQWRAAWCYVTPDVDGIRLKIDLVERRAPEAAPKAPVASPQTLLQAGLDREDALYLGSLCQWLDGKHYSESDLAGGAPSSTEQPGVRREGEALVYNGEVNQIFLDLLSTSTFQKLIITSNGGSISHSLAAGDLLRARNVTVEVRGRCFSACVFVVAGGTSRLAEAKSEIGVHQFYFPDATDSASATAMAQQTSSRIVKYLATKGIDPELFHAMVKVPSTEIRVLPYPELVAWKLLTQEPVRSDGVEEVLSTPPGKQDISNADSKRLVFEARDMVGSDGSVIKDVTQGSCETSCRADTLCKGFTYDKWNRLCILKTGTGLLRLEPRSITVIFSDQAPRESSSVMQMTKRNGRAFPNAPYRSTSSGDFEQCSNACLEDKRCLGVNYTPTNQCQFFDAPNEYARRPGYTIAIKSQISSVQ